MKNIIIVILALTSSVFSCVSSVGLCDRNSDNLYSNDPEVETWIIDNMDEIHQLSVNKLTEETTSFQRQAHWAGKMLEILKLDWTGRERQHIVEMLELIVNYGEFIFSYNPDNEREIHTQIHNKISVWIESAENQNYAKRMIFDASSLEQYMQGAVYRKPPFIAQEHIEVRASIRKMMEEKYKDDPDPPEFLEESMELMELINRPWAFLLHNKCDKIILSPYTFFRYISDKDYCFQKSK